MKPHDTAQIARRRHFGGQHQRRIEIGDSQIVVPAPEMDERTAIELRCGIIRAFDRLRAAFHRAIQPQFEQAAEPAI